jgi:hypothetical protein
MRRTILIFLFMTALLFSLSNCASKSRQYTSEGEEVKEEMGTEGAEAELNERKEENEENLE